MEHISKRFTLSFRVLSIGLSVYLLIPCLTTDSETDSESKNLGTCTCDLIRSSCDINCCCDPDCAALGLVAGFSCLPEGPANRSMHTCHSRGWLHSVNPRVNFWVVADDLEGLLCVAVDNNVIKGVFHSNGKTQAATRIDSTRAVQRVASFGQLLTQLGPSAVRKLSRQGGGYQAGDVLLVRRALSKTSGQILALPQGAQSLQGPDSSETVLGMPFNAPNVLGSCALGTPSTSVRFLVDSPVSSCWLESADLSSICGTFLNYRINNAWMLPVTHLPETDRCGNRCIQPSVSYSCPWNIFSDSGVRTEACTPEEESQGRSSQYVQNGTGCFCLNALRGIKYTIIYESSAGETGVSIKEVRAEATLQDIKSDVCGAVHVEQYTSVQFLEERSAVLGRGSYRSGNPGYRIGLPLLAATCKKYDDISDSCLEFEASPSQSPFATVQGILTDGSCALQGSSSSSSLEDTKEIRFGEDAVFGCTVAYTRRELATACKAGSAQGFANLLSLLPFGRSGNRWTHLAAYGDLRDVKDMNAAGELVEIAESQEGKSLVFDEDTPIRSSTSTCEDAIVGVKLEVLYSPFGDVKNPQARIVAARQSHVKGNLHYVKLDPNESQSFQFHYTVSFLRLDDTGKLEARYPPRPQLPIYLPHDLFYPFGLSRSEALESEHVSMGVTLVLATLLLGGC